ncbi:hypothetical protein IQ06DRAFT_333352 [Phaeosphaeriaceae sp. SRC1lsM3a]|nr:hypothetical protein IQ06DRAFT_333352 [Stagonospora sp. SRC1lsM3a]
MPTNTTTEKFLAGNEKWRPSWKTPPTMEQIRKVGMGPENPLLVSTTPSPRHHPPFTTSANRPFAYRVVTCMDPRCDPSQFLGGDLLFATMRNAGGRVTEDVIRTIAVLRSLNTVSEQGTVAVVHHTDCGMTHLTDPDVLADVKRRTPAEAGRVEDMELGFFTAEEFEETIRKDVKVLKGEKLLEGMDVLGYALITETGELKLVE